MMRNAPERAEKKSSRPAVREHIQRAEDGTIQVSLLLQNSGETVAFRKLSFHTTPEFPQGFYYSEIVKVAMYEGMGFARDLLEKTNRFFDAEHAFCIAYSQIPKASAASSMHSDHGWRDIKKYPPWMIYVPPDMDMPSEQTVLDMILKCRPDYSEYL